MYETLSIVPLFIITTYNVHVRMGQTTVHEWQSHVEIEDYSVAYFDCVVAFEAL